jgi:hypothetical protein
MAEDRAREDTGTFAEEYDKRLWLQVLEDMQSGGTTDIHKEIEKICREEGVDAPTWRTTYNRLQKLEEEDEIDSEKVGDSTRWFVTGSTRKKVVLDAVENQGPATAKALSTGSKLTESDFEEILYQLEEEDKVRSELMGSKLVWMVE